MNVLSLFDGMSCGRLALDRAGIAYDKYYASEIDKHAIKVAQHNYPDTIQLGSVVDVKGADLPKIDLLMGGSPCQGFSFAGKQLNFNDPRSKLFFEFVRLLKECKPKYFLLENVKMKKEYQAIISSHLEVEPIEINSSLVSAQNRKRLYWTNIPIETLPEDKGIMLKDIVHENIDINSSACTADGKAYALTASYNGAVWWNSIERKQKTMLFEELAEYIVPFDKTLQILDKEVEKGKIGYFRKDSQANRVYFIHNKAVTLCGEAGGGAGKMGQYLFGHTKKNSQGNRVYDEYEKACIEGYIRKLTPIECERLQTVPENYTSGVSETQRYKMLGNGWTVDVIAHIFKGLLNRWPQTGQG